MSREPSSLPTWMGKTESYAPKADRDGFITAGILHLVGLLSRARLDGAMGSNRIQPAFRLLAILWIILLMALSRNMFFTYCMAALVLIRICTLPSRSLLIVLRGSLLAAALSALILLPAVFLGSPHTLLTVTLKVFLSVGMLLAFSTTTSWNRITGALRFFHIPNIFIFTLDITLKYIVLLGELALSMLQALRLRSVGKSQSKARSFSGILGVTFLKSRESAEEMYGAMTCRGFEGEYPGPRQFSFRPLDFFYLTIAIGGILLLFLYLEEYLR